MNKMGKKPKDATFDLESKSERGPKFMKLNVPLKYFPLPVVITLLISPWAGLLGFLEVLV